MFSFYYRSFTKNVVSFNIKHIHHSKMILLRKVCDLMLSQALSEMHKTFLKSLHLKKVCNMNDELKIRL